MATDAASKPKAKRTIALLVLATVTALVWSVIQMPSTIRDAMQGIGAGGGVKSPTDFGYICGAILGAALVQCLVVWAVLYFGFVRRQDPARGGIHFLIILSAVLLADFGLFAAVAFS